MERDAIETLYFKDEGWYSERIFKYRGYIVDENYDKDDEGFFHHSCEVFLNNKFITQYNYDEADRILTHIDNMAEGKESNEPHLDPFHNLEKILKRVGVKL